MISFTYTVFYYDGASKVPIVDGSSDNFKLMEQTANELSEIGYETYLKNNETGNTKKY